MRKKAILFTIGILFIMMAGCGVRTKTTASTTQATSNPSSAPQSQAAAWPALDAVDFVSDTLGYVGGQGTILKSVDGGQTWARLYTCPDNVVSIDALDESNVWAATGDYLLRSTDGSSFQRLDPAINAGQGGKRISSIDFVSGDQGYILANGAIWRLTNGTDVQRATPPGRVDSMSFGDPDTGFAASANMVYKTGDGGRTWARIFTAPVVKVVAPYAWEAMIRAGSAKNAWFMVYGGNAGLGHVAYVVFHTMDGTSFTPVMGDGYFASDYPTIGDDVKNNPNVGWRPGTFMVRGESEAFLTGWDPVRLLLTRTADNGKSLDTIDIGAHIDDLPDYDSPFGISFTDARHGWLAGRRNGQGIILRTTDGTTFQAVP